MAERNMTLTELAWEIKSLKEKHAENCVEIEALKKRLTSYDLLAAKWGGVCMLAMAIGTFFMTFGDKIKVYLGIK